MSADSPLTGRLAPSPTGAQHVGNARTYLLAWLSIRSRGGRVIVRMEDIDSPRVKRGAAEQALADLRWLGLDWDEGPDVGGPHSPYVQTQRLPLYAKALEKLMAAERVYPCTCTRSDVAAASRHTSGKRVRSIPALVLTAVLPIAVISLREMNPSRGA